MKKWTDPGNNGPASQKDTVAGGRERLLPEPLAHLGQSVAASSVPLSPALLDSWTIAHLTLQEFALSTLVLLSNSFPVEVLQFRKTERTERGVTGWSFLLHEEFSVFFFF